MTGWIRVSGAPVAAVSLHAAAAVAADQGGIWTSKAARTRLELNTYLLRDLGIATRGSDWRVTREGVATSLIAGESSGLQLLAPDGDFIDVVGGELHHRTDSELVVGEEVVRLDGIVLRPAVGQQRFELRDEGGRLLFTADHAHHSVDFASQRMRLDNLDVKVGPALARLTGSERHAGVAIGMLTIELELSGMPITAPAAPDGCLVPVWPNDPLPLGGIAMADVMLLRISDVGQTAREPGRVAVTPSARLKNVGTADIPWYRKFSGVFPPYGNDQHPFLIWNMYRIEGGAIQQIGRSPLKHAFFATNESCSCSSGQILYAAGCEDTYAAVTNAYRDNLGPRDEVLAYPGIWHRCGSSFDPDCDGDEDLPPIQGPFDRRMAVQEAELGHPNATYVFEAWYLVRDDVNVFNNMGWRVVDPAFTGSVWTFPFTTALQHGPAIDAWIDPSAPPVGGRSATVETSQGRLRLAARSRPILGGGWHRYELALMNLDYDPAVESLEIPIPPGVSVRNVVFRDLDANLDNDWVVRVTSDTLVWEQPSPSPSADRAPRLLTWGTLFSFGFEADAPAAEIDVKVTPHDPDAGPELLIPALAPATPLASR